MPSGTSADDQGKPLAVPPPGTHGGDAPAIAAALGLDPSTVLDLSQTLNPFAPDVAALSIEHLDSLRRYPDVAAATRELAVTIGVDPARVVLTNGGSEAIAIVARELGGRVRSEPEFALHPRGDDGPIWRSDPHSPSGRLAPSTEQADVWDEAFLPLSAGVWTRGRAGVACGSLTKVFACPGLRLGYVIADDGDELARISRHQPHWSVGALGAAIVPTLLGLVDLPGWCADIARARASLAELLVAAGFEVVVADAPWVLVHAPGLRERLAWQGVVVRDAASFGLDGWVRVAVPDDAGIERLMAALAHAGPTD